MQIAEILSDLDTLRVCDAPAALALVSASTTTTYPFPAPSIAAVTKPSDTISTSQQQHQQPEGDKAGANTSAAVDDDADLTRAKDLIALHELFKGEGGAAGKMAELSEARGLVDAAMRGL